MSERVFAPLFCAAYALLMAYGVWLQWEIWQVF
jgi:hypothetical protein